MLCHYQQASNIFLDFVLRVSEDSDQSDMVNTTKCVCTAYSETAI